MSWQALLKRNLKIFVIQQRWRQNGTISGEKDCRAGDGTAASATEH